MSRARPARSWGPVRLVRAASNVVRWGPDLTAVATVRRSLGQATAMSIRTLAIFGVTGRTGLVLAQRALARGWPVRGFVRRASVPPSLSGVSIVRGAFEDADRVRECVRGADAVSCVIGPRPPYTARCCAPATQAIVEAMRAERVQRFVCQTGAMIGTGNRTIAFEWMGRTFARRHSEAALDREEQERIVEASGLDWTLVKPVRLTDGRARGRPQTGEAIRVGMLSSISRADLADFTLDAIEYGQGVGARLFVKGRRVRSSNSTQQV